MCDLREIPTGHDILVWRDEHYDCADVQNSVHRLLQKLKKALYRVLYGETRPPQSVQDQSLMWESLLDIGKNSPWAVKLRCVKEAHIPEIDESGLEVIKFVETLEARYRDDPRGFDAAMTELEALVLSAVYVLSAGVMRAPDIAAMQLPDLSGVQVGNVHFESTYFMSGGLKYVEHATKNQRLFATVINFIPSRLLVLLLRICRRFSVRSFITSVENEFTKRGIQGVISPDFRAAVERYLTTTLTAMPIPSPHLYSLLASGPSALKSEDLDARAVRVRDSKEVRATICAIVAGQTMNSAMSFAAMRHFMTVFKTHAHLFADQTNKRGGSSPGTLDALNALAVARVRLDRLSKSIQTGSGASGHSALTELLIYQAQTTVGSKELPTLLLSAARQSEAEITLAAGLPYRNLPSKSASSATQGFSPPISISGMVGPQVKETLLTTMREKENSPEGFKCAEQKALADAIVESVAHVGGHLPCGTGKTSAVVIPASLALWGFMLYVVPYIALRDSLELRFRSMGINCEVFDPKNESRFGGNCFARGTRSLSDPVRIILVVTETAASETCADFCRAALASGQLLAVVFDEAHSLLFQSGFRPAMLRLPFLALHGVRVIVLSGTLPRSIEQTLWDLFGMSVANTFSVRADPRFSGRFEISLVPMMEEAGITVVNEYVMKLVQRFLEREGQRRLTAVGGTVEKPRSVLIFSLTKDYSKRAEMKAKAMFQDAVRTVRMDADTPDKDRVAFLRSFEDIQNPKPLVAFATTACAEGIDFPNVGAVFVVAGAYGGILTAIQMIARGGRSRNAEHAEGFIVYAPLVVETALHGPQEVEAYDRQAIKPFLRSERAAAKRLVTFQSFAHLFSPDNQGRCGAILLEELCSSSGKSESGPCGSCAGCCRGASRKWKYPLPPPTPSIPRNVAAFASRPGNAKERAVVAHSSEDADFARAYLLLEESITTCYACDGNAHHQNFPRACWVLDKIVRDKFTCFWCINPGHNTKLVDEALESAKDDRDKQYRLLRPCGVVVAGCSKHSALQPCTRCMFAHGQQPCTGLPRAVAARTVLAVLWHIEPLRTEFLSDEEISTWSEFFDFMIYSGDTRGRNNLYAGLAFLDGKRHVWRELRDRQFGKKG